ncbi:hypothetical protein PIROE2DRAFT_13817 [Piromyces sp. E2]|nr:hypothetical protein PIROE2DRAFT_13817 [Piromyces sp. E2]|eukprot:OUM60430.1 hypothetical protein PIROE2DRAFT_13817 [Piromyces sp. E2]
MAPQGPPPGGMGSGGPPPGGMGPGGPPPGGMGPLGPPPGAPEGGFRPGEPPTTPFSMQAYASGVTMLFKDCLFYAAIVQYVMITYMYVRVGKGKMWQIFYYGSLSLFFGQVIEHLLMPLTQFKDVYKYAFLCYIPLETFYVIAEYCIPFINYLKLKAVSRNNYTNKIKILLIIVFPLFAACRYLMGIYRYIKKDVNPDVVRNYKGASSSIIAVLDLLISILIIFELRQNLGMERMQKKYLQKTSVYTYIRKSNYAVLILIDFVGFILSFLSYSYVSPNIMDIVMPFQTLKDNFLLILAIDAVIFKVDCFKMLSSGKTVNPNGKGSYSNSYTGISTSNVNNSVSNFNGSYGVLSNYSTNNTINYNQNIGSGVLSSSQPLFSGNNKFNNNNNGGINKPEFGSFHAANAFSQMNSQNDNNFMYEGSVKLNFSVNNMSDNDEKQFYNEYSDSKISTQPLNPLNPLNK